MYQNGRLLAAGTGALTINGVLVEGLGNVATSNVGTIVLHKGQFTIGGLVNIGSAAAPGGKLTTTLGRHASASSRARATASPARMC